MFDRDLTCAIVHTTIARSASLSVLGRLLLGRLFLGNGLRSLRFRLGNRGVLSV